MGHSNDLTIKGTRNGLLITLPADGGLAEILQQLRMRLQASASFFKGGRVALCVGWRTLESEDIEQIGAILSENGVTLWSVLSDSESTQRAARRLGLETDLSEPMIPQPARLPEPDEGANVTRPATAIFVQRTLRSGQRIQHSGHVVVIGDVNPGAEIIAGGHVIVWGKLRGTVHAGANGDDGAVVCALSLVPTQLRIGNYIARSPDTRPPRIRTPEMASVQNGEIVAEPWTGT